jgi:thiol:disulfide interchange protein DsbD
LEFRGQEDQRDEVHMTATVEGGWHLYSQACGPGPVPTHFIFQPSAQVVPTGKIMEIRRLITAPDAAFKATLKYYQNTADFVQKVTVKGKAPATLNGRVEFMVSNIHQAVPPKVVDFSVKLQ